MSQNEPILLSFKDIWKFLWKWRKHYFIISIISIVLASVFSGPFFIKPKYKSTVIFYPSTNNSTSNALLTELNQRQKDPLDFGAEEEAEKALQILGSSKLQDRIIRNFNLMKHYKIEGDKPQTKLANKIRSNIKYSRTRFLSIQIDVLDEDPKMAAKIATGIVNLYDSVKREIQHEVAVEALAIVERAMNAKKAEIENLHKQMEELGNKGVTNYEEESRSIAEAINEARLRNNAKLVESLIEQQKALVRFGGQALSVKEKIILEEDRLSKLIVKYDNAKIDVEEELKAVFIVSEAGVAEEKSYPVRKMVVLFSLLATLILSTIVILSIDQIKKLRNEIAA